MSTAAASSHLVVARGCLPPGANVCVRAGNGSMGHGSNGSRKSDGSHGSWVTRC